MINEKQTEPKYSKFISCFEMVLYVGRWQLSTFTMTPVILLAAWLGVINSWEQVALANLISAPFFFFIDKFILIYVRKLIHVKKEVSKNSDRFNH